MSFINTEFENLFSSVSSVPILESVSEQMTETELQTGSDLNTDGVLIQHLSAMEGYLKTMSESNPQYADYTSQFTEIQNLLEISNKANEDLQGLNLVSVATSICIAFLISFLLGFYIAAHFFKRM